MYFQNRQNELIRLTPTLFQEKFGVKELETLLFLDDKTRERVLKKVAKKLSKESCYKRNQWTTSLYGEDRKRSTFDHLYIRMMNPLVGYGVYTLSSIPAYSYAGEYTGIVRKRARWKDRRNDYVFGYDIGSDRTSWIIDAKEQGNFTRFFNHSFTPNLTSGWIIDDGICHIIFFSNRLIQRGEQLTYDYGPYFWKKRSHPITI